MISNASRSGCGVTVNVDRLTLELNEWRSTAAAMPLMCPANRALTRQSRPGVTHQLNVPLSRYWPLQHLPLYALNRFNGFSTWRVWPRLIPQRAPTHRHFLDRMTPHFLTLSLMLSYQETLSSRPAIQKKPRRVRRRFCRLQMKRPVLA